LRNLYGQELFPHIEENEDRFIYSEEEALARYYQVNVPDCRINLA
jgi:hypothetical protein